MRLRRYSIFIKLLSIIAGTGIIITMVFISFFRLHFNARMRDQFSANLGNYFTYIAKDIGSPPDTLKAKELSGKYFIAIRYESKTTQWQCGNFKFESFEKLRRFFRFDDGFWKENPLVIVNKDGSKFLFAADFHKIINPNPAEFVILLFILAAILTINYFAIRKILKPIKYLSAGVDELSKGNLDSNIPIKSRDELAYLSQSFNEMTKKIKNMIKARDQLLLDVSHELRSPITRIKLALEFIKDDKSKESISSDIKEIEVMITEILESERLKNENGKLKLTKCNVYNLLNEVAEYYKDSKPPLVIKDVSKDLELNIDEIRIKLVFKNLIDNAIKYSHPQSRPVTIFVEELPDKAVINIKDDGIGIPDEDIPFIFEPFFRVDKSRTRKTGGYGLGLSLCKKIIEAHGGKISLTNNQDRGSTARIELRK